MAVTKIRKISSWSLLIMSIISVIALAFFFFGGIVDPGAEYKEPVYLSLLLNWIYVLLIITVAATIIFAIWQFTTLLKDNPKSAITSLIAIIAFTAILFITYSIGNGTPLQLIGYEGEFNVPFWLKVTDMWLYSSYILTVLIVVAVIAGSVKRMLDK